MMKRRRSRECALQILFQLELSGNELSKEIWDEFWTGVEEGNDVKKYTRDIVETVRKNLQSIDKVIIKAAQHWSLERMAVIDRNILRAATYELTLRKDIPPSVAINEAIEIAKKFSTEESASFINGILDKIAHDVSPKSRVKEKHPNK